MKLIVGLGNPGETYSGTRHNAGKLFVQFLAESLGLRDFTEKRKLKASVAQVDWSGCRTVLAWPETFMNLSGESVRQLLAAYGCDPECDMLVVVDDLDLPFGKVRLRAEGSDGGHKGLRSIQALLGTKRFARLRIGIGRPARFEQGSGPAESVEEFVLSRFKKSEEKELRRIFSGIAEGCAFWIQGQSTLALNYINSIKQTT
ncbi:MAG: aminoacyl-tRNA hydrolase [Candidatus Omnitrophica bacterium]|nr:aminoacyl-tRNA hydrolase [Candidatus Omnitrophota bacterium]